MMIKGSVLSLVASMMLAISPSFACDEKGTTGIVEDNNLYIPANVKSINSITEADFNDVIDKVSAIYAPIIAAKKRKLVVERKWDDGTVNAYAQQQGTTWKVSMFGGLARHEAITKDGFTYVICHEIGHHIGGAPKKASWFGSSWASNEGQADFWAGAKCMKKVFEKEDNISLMATMNVPSEVKTACSENFNNAQDVAICERGSMAGLSLGNLFKALRKLRTPLSFSTPDANVVTKTNDNHPAPQCRLDTYYQGSLCDVDPYADVSKSDANLNICSRANGDKLGNRPLCWYKPATI